MGKIFDEAGKVRNRDDLLDVNFGGKAPSRKVTDHSTERASITRVEDDHGSSLNITPKTVDFTIGSAHE